VSDPRYQDLVGSYVSVARRVDGRAAEQVAEQGGKMTKGQLLALKQTVSYLNRNGIVWSDNHLGNFKFTRLDPDKDIWSLDIFDTGGFYKMLGDTPADEFRNARTLQRAFNPGDNDFMSNYRAARQAGDVDRVKDMERARALSIGKASRNIDWDAFDTPVENLIGTAISSSPTMRPNYRLLDNLNPADADKLYARHTGKTPAVGLPIDPGDVRGQGPLPDSILDAVDRRWTEDALRADPQGSGGSGSGSGTIRDDPTGTGGTGTGGTGTGGGGGSGGTGGTGGGGGGGAAADAGDEGTWVLPYRENFRSLDEPPAPRIETERIRTVREDMRDIEALGRTSPTETLDMGDLDALVRRLEAEEAGFDAFRNAETERFTRAEERALDEVAESERLQRMRTYLDEQDTFKSYDDLEEYIRANRLSEISFRVGDDGATESRQLGEFVGGGAFNEVIRDGQNADQVLRVSKYVEGHDMHRLEAQGRKGGEAAALARPDDLIVPTRRGYFPNVSSRDPRLNGKTIEYVDNVPEQTAKELFALNGGQPNPWQADAYARGVRALNDQGHILADAHPGNYTFRSRPGTDRLTMVIIDPGAVVRAEGGLPANARLAQDMIDNPAQDLVERWAVAGPDNKYRWAAKKTVLMKEGLEDLIDLDTLGVRHGDFVPMAPQGAEIFPDAAELLRLSPEDAARRLEEMMRDFRNAETERIPIAATPRDGTAIVPLKPGEPHFRLLDLAA